LTSFFAFLDLGFGDFAGVNQSLDALLREVLAMLTHAKCQQLTSEPVLPAVLTIVVVAVLALPLSDRA
jgi:hypothetical protein